MLNQSLMANELISHACVMHKNVKGGGWRSFHVGQPDCFHVSPSSTMTETPLFWTLPYVSLHLIIDSYPLIAL